MMILKVHLSMISGFHHKVDENCSLLGYYAGSGGNLLLLFQDNVWVPSSRVIFKKKMGLSGCPAKSVRNHHHSLCNNPEECSFQINLIPLCISFK
jgi:hypothetical protein